MFNFSNLRETLESLLYALPAIVIALSFHEFMHGAVAYALGDPTAKNAGRLTLNPIKHFDPIGLLMMVVFHFGWARPVPINSAYFRRPKLGIVLTSLAGPLANFLLGFLSLNLYFVFELFGAGMPAALQTVLCEFFAILASYNISLGLFNLIPIPPLDGSKVLYAVLPQRAYYTLLRYESYGMLLLIVLMFFNILTPVLTTGYQWIMKCFLNVIGSYLIPIYQWIG